MGAGVGPSRRREIPLANGERIAEAEAPYLAPATPSKIIAVHLTYRTRVEEYAARTPPLPRTS